MGSHNLKIISSIFRIISTTNSNTPIHDGQRRRINKANEVERRSQSHHRKGSIIKSAMRQGVVGILEEEQLAGSRKQAVFYSRQKDGTSFWTEKIRAFSMSKFLSAHLTEL